jgi:hypothetical protein
MSSWFICLYRVFETRPPNRIDESTLSGNSLSSDETRIMPNRHHMASLIFSNTVTGVTGQSPMMGGGAGVPFLREGRKSAPDAVESSFP